MLELRRERTVPGHCRPAIGQHLGLGPAQIDHRLDGEEHARLQPCAGPPAAVMQHVGRRMEHPPQPVAAEIPHDRTALGLGMGLDRRADIAEGGTRADLLDPLHQRVMGDLDQPLGPAAGAPRDIHPAGIAVPALDDHGHVDVQDVAVAQQLVARDAMADHMVHADAGGVLVALVADGRRGHAQRLDPAAHEIVDRACRHAGFHEGPDGIEDVRHHMAGSAHPGEVLRFMKPDSIPRRSARTTLVHARHLLRHTCSR
jgi:hypothetical protein